MADFTANQIEEIISIIENEFAKQASPRETVKGIAAGVTQYVGARYVPLFAEPLEWDSTRAFEPLTIVLHNGNSYTSRQYVPVGIEIDNTAFWALTGNYNAQVEQYRQEVINLRNLINGTLIPAVNENTKNISAETERAEGAEDALGKLIATNTENIAKNKQAIADEKSERMEDTETLTAKVDVWFDTVADMKAATNLSNGMTVHTNGFHAVNDGGAAFYRVSDTGDANEMDVIGCQGGLVASLNANGAVYAEQLGAYGDGMHDDYKPITRLFNVAKLCYLTKTYKTSNTLIISSDKMVVHGTGSTIKYEGTDSAIKVTKGEGITLYLGNVYSTGNGLELYSDGNTNYVQYLNVYFNKIGATNACVYTHAADSGWVNEIRFYNGRFEYGKYGIYADSNSCSNLESYSFINIGVETPDVGFYLANMPYCNWSIFQPRTGEAKIVLKTVGSVSGVHLYASGAITSEKFDLSKNTMNCYIYSTLYIKDTANITSPVFGVINGNIVDLIGAGYFYNAANLANISTDIIQASTIRNISLINCGKANETIEIHLNSIGTYGNANTLYFSLPNSATAKFYAPNGKLIKTFTQTDDSKVVKITILARSNYDEIYYYSFELVPYASV